MNKRGKKTLKKEGGQRDDWGKRRVKNTNKKFCLGRIKIPDGNSRKCGSNQVIYQEDENDYDDSNEDDDD